MAVIIWDILLQWFKAKFKFPRYNITPHISQTFSSQEYFSGNNSLNKKSPKEKSWYIMAINHLNTLLQYHINYMLKVVISRELIQE